MVFFICNCCGESLKKNKVQQHSYACRGMSTVSCIDCNQNFDLRSFNNHKQCLHEDEKYGGANYQKKETESKGQRKQEQWIQRVHEVAQNSNVSPKIKSYLETLLSFDNIPRKKAKFVNFARNSIRTLNVPAIEELWSLFEKANQKDSSNGNSENKQNGVSSKRPAEEETTETKVAKKSKKEVKTEETENTNGQHTENEVTETAKPVKLIKLAKEILKENNAKMKRKKFDKLVYKSYNNSNPLDFDVFHEKLYGKLGNKSKFVITDKYIELA